MKSLLICLLFLNLTFLKAQTNFANDCISAMQVCSSNVNIEENQLNSFGNNIIEFDFASNCIPFQMKGVWLRIKINESGLLGFNIIPSNPNHDVDFALFKMNNISCDQLLIQPNNYTIACNYSSNTTPTAVTGCNNDPNYQNSPMVLVNQNDIYYLFIGILTTNNLGPILVDFSIGTCGINYECSNFHGFAFNDENNDCIRNNNEGFVSNINICLQGNDNFFCSTTNENGEYFIQVPTQSTLNLTTPFNSLFYSFNCLTNQEFTFSNSNTIIQGPDLPINILEYCKMLKLSSNTCIHRPCNVNNRYFTISNIGSENVDSTELFINYNDTLVVPYYFSHPYNYLGNNSYSVKVYNINPSAHEVIQVSENISCNASIGDTVCVNSWLDNYFGCNNFEELSGSILTEFFVENNEKKFKISNNSTSIIQLNISLYDYLVNEYVEIGNVNVQISPSGSEEIVVPSNVESLIYQMNAFLFQTQYSVFINNELSLNQNQNHEIFDNVICSPIKSSYDPNEIIGVYQGLGNENLINRDLNLKYRINFQNTGNDTAFVVKIKLNLSEFLQNSSIIPSISSHNYQFQMIENEINFIFNNILLVDSLTNEPGSHGFVEFFINQKTENPLSYDIESTASIYFDFNVPIITNTHVYRIRPLLNLKNEQNTDLSNLDSFNFYPNPTSDMVFINSIKGLKNTKIIICDFLGRKLIENSNYEFNTPINVNELKSGLYFINILDKDSIIKTVKFVKH